MALRLARLFGNTREFWLNAQRAVDLWDTAEAIRKDVSRIKPLSAAWHDFRRRAWLLHFSSKGADLHRSLRRMAP